MSDLDDDELHARAYETFDAGHLSECVGLFAELERRHPDHSPYSYMLGLAHKYLRAWAPSLQANLRALATRTENEEGAAWNAAIAATALGDWAQARTLWARCGVRVPDGDGPIAMSGGLVGMRLNPWGNGETLFALRIDPARARLRNVPLPRSGYRYDDLVLHDGAAQGRRYIGDDVVPVFNALERLERSAFDTFAVFASCPTQADVEALLALEVDGIGHVEDWTANLQSLCLRCSYGKPHAHHERPPGAWDPQRSLGVAARDRATLQRLIDAWTAGRADRVVEDIESDVVALSSPDESHVWWEQGDEEDDEDGA